MADTDQASRYREIARLGAGGMATVMLAEDTVLGRRVALKRVHADSDPRGLLRVEREARVGASLNHPNLVFVYDVRTAPGGDVVIVMEYVEGEPLSDVLRARGGLAPEEALRILEGVAAALDAIHRRGIVHRDVKPANVLLGLDGAVKLADLGVADVADRTRITTAGGVVGSFSYMAPEQLDGSPPSRAMDIYALAALAYEIFAGERARPEPNPLALAHAISTSPPPDLRKVWAGAPAPAAKVLQRGMSVDPAKRPASAGELVRRLGAAFGDAGRSDRRGARPTPVAARPRPIERPTPAAARHSSIGPAAAATVIDRSRAARLTPALLALAAVGLVAAVLIVATLTGGGAHRPRVAGSAGRRATAGTTSRRRAAPASPASAGSSGTPSSGSGSPATLSAGTSADAGTPSGAVRSFYDAASQHRYVTAWALADTNLRSELGGYSAFVSEMSPVRSITFHRAQTLGVTGSSTATVALETTSVQLGRTQQCSGTARTVRGGPGWLLDGISIGCT